LLWKEPKLCAKAFRYFRAYPIIGTMLLRIAFGVIIKSAGVVLAVVVGAKALMFFYQ
jgi:hypothetical protein